MTEIKHPFYPIIYVRGYAMSQGEIDDTVATPYMGFNLGATKIRQDWEGKVRRHIFESPLIRLMKDYQYEDIYQYGQEKQENLSPKSVVIYRYYEEADTELGHGERPSIPKAAQGLSKLILELRDKICKQDPQALQNFKVYLVAHSMGGLVCRCFLQNPDIGTAESKALVDKVFTYATPHNGIEMAGFNVPDFLRLWDINNFSREVMAKYLGLPGKPDRVDSLDGKFDPARFFCLVGTNHKDYTAGAGMSSKLAGEMSDGLVKIENAAVRGAPRAFVHRSHSGHYGIVNSEEGYQNLIRFLFGDYQADGYIEVEELPLPPSVRKARNDGKDIKASYFFESTVSPRGAITYKLTERRKETYSAVFRKFDELLRVDRVAGLNQARSPFMFSIFLDKKRIAVGKKAVFSVELAVSATDYEIEGFLFFDRTIPGEYLFRNTVVLSVAPGDNGFNVKYSFSDDSWAESTNTDVKSDDQGMYIPLSSKKGFKGKLRIVVKGWNQEAK
jgi:pimeloyl-ACP methyl ester carboxylesterase